MQWLNSIVEVILAHHPEGEIIIESGVSPSGVYHVGTLREVLTADAIKVHLEKLGHKARHIHFVDDFDALRKIPAGVSSKYEKYLGQPLYHIPAPDNSGGSWADYYLRDFLKSTEALGVEMNVIRSHQKYQEGFFAPAIEVVLENIDSVRQAITQISGRHLEENWSPIQVMEDEYLKMRPFVSLDKQNKTVTTHDKDGNPQVISYADGKVKLNWRIDWPARWWLQKINSEPFGRDHATKGGSYDTGAQLMKAVFKQPPPVPVPYQFINRSGQTKKMSKSAGDTISVKEVLEVLPPEAVRFFVLRYSPDKQLFFDETHGVVRLIDEFAELVAKLNKTKEEDEILYVSTLGLPSSTVSSVPFSHLVESYQAALKDPQKTLEVLRRTEHAETVRSQEEVIKKELGFIEQWLEKWAPEDVKFELRDKADPKDFSTSEKAYLSALSTKVARAPANADGEWFHKAIYEFDDSSGLSKQQLFTTIYKALIGKTSGPRAGWFLSILPRDWLVRRLRLEA